jgi:hypothetical protein
MDLIDRLHRRLLAALPAATPDATPLEFTIADVYQRLIPYRSVRTDLGVMELAEYENALLRLLAGERNYLDLEDASIQLELRRELASVNPILGIYRDYADAKLRPGLGESAEPRAAEKPKPAAEAPAERPAGEPTESSLLGRSVESPPQPAPSTEQASETKSCWSCGRVLPELADLLYCPHCGMAQAPVPCRRCASAIAPDWSFCVRCGATRNPSLER